MADNSTGPVFEFAAELWRHQGEAPWHFLTVPPDLADEIDDLVGHKAGFDSIPIEVTIGTSTWKTSLFPDKAAASFVLPVKAAVRKAEGVGAGARVKVRMRHDSKR